MARDDQILRQWRLWRLLSNAHTPLSAEELVSQLQPDTATSRTIRRDLEVLKQLGVNVQDQKEGRTVRYAVLDDGPPMRLNGDALLALRLALGLLRPFDGTDVGDTVQQITRHLEACIPHRALDHFHALLDDLVVRQPSAPSYDDQREVLASLRAALASGKVVRLSYQALNAEEPTERVLHPQALVYGPKGLYLLAVDPERTRPDDPDHGVRTYRVDRIIEVHPSPGDQPAQQVDLDVEDYLAGSIGVFSPEHEPKSYEIRLHSTQVARILAENPWHPSQVIEPELAGTHRLTLQLTSPRELLSRVLALGPDAEVLEPLDFRQLVQQVTQRALGRYVG